MALEHKEDPLRGSRTHIEDPLRGSRSSGYLLGRLERTYDLLEDSITL